MGDVTKNRILAFDFIRFIAIILVVISHEINVGDLAFDPLYLGILGNVLFFFISGYLIYLNNSNIKCGKDILHFYKKRLLRIYPLYIVAVLLGLLIAISNGSIMDYSIFEIIMTFCGLQMVFYPKHIVHLLLWFIGMIVIFYLVYPLIVYMSNKNIIKFISLSIGAIGILVILHIITGLVGGGVFEYYFVFILGVLAAWIKIFDTKYIKWITVLSALLFVSAFIFGQICNPAIKSAEYLALSPSVILYVCFVILYRIVYGISGAILLYAICKFINPKKLFEKIIINGAFAAYAVYLFHGSLIELFNKVFYYMGRDIYSLITSPIIYNVLLIVVYIPLLFIIGYYIQKCEGICINKIKGKITMKG